MTSALPASRRSWGGFVRDALLGPPAPELFRPDFIREAGAGDAVIHRRREDDLIALRRRARIGMSIWLLGTLIIAVMVDPVVHRDVLWELYAGKLVLIAAGVSIWWFSGRARRQALIYALVGGAILLAAVLAYSSTLVGEDWSAAVICTLLAAVTAGLLPWGVRAQLVAALGIAIFAVLPVIVLAEPQKVAFMMSASIIGVLSSVAIAAEQERYRRESWQSLLFFRENMERLREVAEHIDGVLWLKELVDWDGAYLYVSPRYEDVWGLDRAALRDRPDAWLDAVHPEDRTRVEVHFQRGAAQGDYDCEYRLLRSDGSIRWIHDYAFPIREGEDRIRRVARLSQDVTAEKEAAEGSRMRDLARGVQATREEERRRIARELHDELGQALTGIKLRLVGQLWNNEATREEIAGTMRTCIGEIEEAMQAVHRMIYQLRPPILDDLGLLAALRVQADSFVSRTGIRCQLDIPELEPELSEEEVTAVFRVAQESLTNVARHAHATEVVVSLSAQRELISLCVADDGRGIGESKQAFGLRGMSERAALLNGTLRVLPRLERGTVVHLEIPRLVGGAGGYG